jgi:hypothetical protein
MEYVQPGKGYAQLKILCELMCMFREVISSLLKTVEPEEEALPSHDRYFGPVGVNDVWPQDQHDKWGRFGLWIHAGVDSFSGEFNWLNIWWTNKNPRLITRYYLDTCRRIGGKSQVCYYALVVTMLCYVRCSDDHSK